MKAYFLAFAAGAAATQEDVRSSTPGSGNIVRFNVGGATGLGFGNHITDAHEWERKYCQAKGGSLPSYEQLCPLNDSAEPIGGCADNWAPLSDGKWVDVGCSVSRRCKITSKSDILAQSGGKYGRELYCYMDTAKPTPAPTPHTNTWTTTDTLDPQRVSDLDTAFGLGSEDEGAWAKDAFVIRPHMDYTTPDGVSHTVKHHSVQCEVHQWHEFTECSATCGGGIQTRQHKETDCPFDVYHQKCCNTEPCDVADQCGAGHFMSRKATLNLETCGPTHTASGQPDWGTCEVCEAGTFRSEASSVFASTSCTACPSGSYCPEAATTPISWTSCAKGERKVGHTHKAPGRCESCPAHQFNPTDTEVIDECTKCPTGRQGNGGSDHTSEDAQCELCSAGFANDVEGEECKACLEGTTFQDHTGAVTCSDCSPDDCGLSKYPGFPTSQQTHGAYQSKNCSATSDRICNDLPTVAGFDGKIVVSEPDNNVDHVSIPLAQAADVIFDTSSGDSITRVELSISTEASLLDDYVSGMYHYDHINDVWKYVAESCSGWDFFRVHYGLRARFSPSANDSPDQIAQCLKTVQIIHRGQLLNADKLTKEASLKLCTKPNGYTAADEDKFCTSHSVEVIIRGAKDAPKINHISSNTRTYYQNDGPIHLASGAQIYDADSERLSSIEVQLTPWFEGDQLSTDARIPADLQVSFTEGKLTIKPRDTSPMNIKGAELLLRSVVYANNAPEPNKATRDVRIVATDVHGSSSSTTTRFGIEVCGTHGTFVDEGVIKTCPVGKYQPARCMEDCLSCVPGKFGNVEIENSKESHCEDCLAGQYQTKEAEPSCTACAAGKYGPAGTGNSVETYCQECMIGMFQGNEGMTQCEICEENSYTDTPGSATCTAVTVCEAGHFKRWDQPSGEYHSHVPYQRKSNGSCIACAVGKYQPSGTSGSLVFACQNCPKGSEAINEGSSTCTACTAGENGVGGTFKREDGDDLCQPAKKCTAGQYESKAVTPTSDRNCDDASLCLNPDEYVKVPHNATENSVCGTATTCAKGQYVTRDLSSNKDRECESCSIGKFSSDENAESCTSWRQCGECEGLSEEGTDTEDRQCKACAVGAWETLPAYASLKSAKGWTKIIHGKAKAQEECEGDQLCFGMFESNADQWHLFRMGTQHTHILCCDASCRNAHGLSGSYCERTVMHKSASTYSDASDASKCKAVDTTPCADGEQQVESPTTCSQRRCAPCPTGMWSTGGQACKPWRTCPEGYGLKTEGTPTADRECRKCDFQHFDSSPDQNTEWSNTDDGSQCNSDPPCSAGFELTVDPTGTTPRQCTKCQDSYFKATAGNSECVAKRACGAGMETLHEGDEQTQRTCTECVQDKTYSTGKGGHSDKCDAVTECTSSQYEFSKPTLTEDRVCKTKQCTCANGTPVPDGESCLVHDTDQCQSCKNVGEAPFAFGTSGFYLTAEQHCESWNVCDESSPRTDHGEYESTAPSGTVNRLCAQCEECSLAAPEDPRSTGQFVKTECKGNTNSVCADVRQCDFDKQFELTPLTETSDRVCKDLTPVGEAQYIHKTHTDTTDRDVRDCTQCPFTTGSGTDRWMKTECSTHADTDCQPFHVYEDDTEWESKTPTSTSDRHCSTVKQACPEGQYEVKEPTTTSDRECVAWTECEVDEYEMKKPDRHAAWVSEEVNGDRKCAPQRFCTDPSDGKGGEYETKAPTYDENGMALSIRECASCRACDLGDTYGAGYFTSSKCQGNSDRSCAALTVCDVKEWKYEVKAPTQFTDRDCGAINTCEAGFVLGGYGPAAAGSCTECADNMYLKASAPHREQVCLEQPECLSGQFISADTKTDRRVCSDCGDNEYQPLNNHREETCMTQPHCPIGTYITADSKTERRTCLLCGENEYQPLDEHRELACLEQTECGPGTYISEDSKENKRTCHACPPNTYRSDDKHREGACIAQTSCGVGEYLHGASDSTKGTCLQCGSDTYQDAVDHHEQECKTQQTCVAGQYISADSFVARRTCSACEPDKYQDSPEHRETECKPNALCDAGTYLQGATRKAKGECMMCGDNTYQPDPNHRHVACLDQRTCAAGEFISADSKTALRTCAACAVGTYQDATNHREIACKAQPECALGFGAEQTTDREIGFTVKACDGVNPCSATRQGRIRVQEHDELSPHAFGHHILLPLAAGPTHCNTTNELEKVTIALTNSKSGDTVMVDLAPGMAADWDPSRTELTLRGVLPLSTYQDVVRSAVFGWVASSNHVRDTRSTCVSCTSNTFSATKSALLCSASAPTCPEGMFETAPPTTTSDRQCQPLAVCNCKTHFEQVAPTATTNRKCKEIRIQTDAQFESKAPTLDSDREVQGRTCCAAGKYKVYDAVSPYPTSNGRCETCATGSWIEAGGDTWTSECDSRKCTVCAAGHYGSGDHDSIAHCKPCAIGTANDQDGVAGSCASCTAGTNFAASEGQTQCEQCSDAEGDVCGDGQYRARLCTVTADRGCESKPAIVNWDKGAFPYTENDEGVRLAQQAEIQFANNTLSFVHIWIGSAKKANDKLKFTDDGTFTVNGITIRAEFQNNNQQVYLRADDHTSNKAAFEAALQQMQFYNTGDMKNQHMESRDVTVSAETCHASDTAVVKSVCSEPVTMTVHVHPVNDAPTVTVPTGDYYPHHDYVQNGDAVRVLEHVEINDVDHDTIKSATIRIEGAFSGDTLTVDIKGHDGIQIAFDTATGTLALQGPASNKEYTEIVNSVAFRSTAELPHLGSRGFKVQVTDGKGKSSEDTRAFSRIHVHSAAGFFEDVALGRIQRCPEGSYTTATNQPSCTLCAPGTFGSGDRNKSEHCQRCPDGEFQLLSGKSACVKCAAGKMGNEGTSQGAVNYCSDCALGKYQSADGQTSCNACPGTDDQEYADQVGATKCKKWDNCGAGKYKTGNTAVQNGECVECVQGKYRTEEMAASERFGACAECDVGTYGDSSVLSVSFSGHCQACAAGKYQDKKAQTVQSNPCVPCAAGTTSGSGAATCVDCPDGTFQTNTGTATGGCHKCEVGKFGFLDDGKTPKSEASYCHWCELGYHNKESGKHSSDPTAPEHVNVCAPCEAGKHPNMDISHGGLYEHCVDCAPGRFEDMDTETRQSRYPGNALLEQCRACPENTYQPAYGAKECLGCTDHPNDDDFILASCGEHQYVSNLCTATADRTCDTRPVITGASGDVTFTEGPKQTQASSVDIVSTPKIEFHLQSDIVVSVKLTEGANANDKLIVPEGNVAVSSSNDHEVKLDGNAVAGHEGGARAALAHALTQIKFQTVGDMHQQHTDRKVHVEMKACYKGWQKATAPKIRPEVCGPTSVVRVTVSPINDLPEVTVDLDKDNTYIQGAAAALKFARNANVVDVDHEKLASATIRLENPQPGDKLACSLVPGMKSSWNPDQSELVLTSGSSELLHKSIYQQVIRSATFHHSSATELLSTLDRQFSIFVNDGVARSTTVAVLTVKVCAAVGSYSDGTTGFKATQCAPGKFVQQTCATQCESCGAGTFGNTDFPNQCQNCKQGTYQPKQAQTSCDSCPEGRFGGDSYGPQSAAHCIACAVGQYQPAKAAVECIACSTGTFADVEALAVCNECSAGKYAAQTGASQCTLCVAGKASGGKGAESESSCVDCDSGRYAAAAGAAVCDLWDECLEGEHNPTGTTTNKGECTACEYGRYMNRKNRESDCHSWGDSCPAGEEMLGMSATKTGTCTLCPAGAYRAAPAGDASVKEKYAGCSLCTAGKFLSTTGGKSEEQCANCEIGKFQEATGASECDSCDADHFGVVRHDGTTDQTSKSKHCASCGAWEPWSACTATCGPNGVRTRLRHAPLDGGDTCATTQTEPCNRVQCPERNLCTYIKCRYQKNAENHFSVQVYHHRKEPNAVHHCRLYEGSNGEDPLCHCYCWDQGEAPALTTGTNGWHTDSKLGHSVEDDMLKDSTTTTTAADPGLKK